VVYFSPCFLIFRSTLPLVSFPHSFWFSRGQSWPPCRNGTSPPKKFFSCLHLPFRAFFQKPFNGGQTGRWPFFPPLPFLSSEGLFRPVFLVLPLAVVWKKFPCFTGNLSFFPFLKKRFFPQPFFHSGFFSPSVPSFLSRWLLSVSPFFRSMFRDFPPVLRAPIILGPLFTRGLFQKPHGPSRSMPLGARPLSFVSSRLAFPLGAKMLSKPPDFFGKKPFPGGFQGPQHFFPLHTGT